MAKQKEAWDKLSMQEKALLIKLSVENGVSSLKLIRDTYNLYSSGGNLAHKKSGEELGENQELNTKTYKEKKESSAYPMHYNVLSLSLGNTDLAGAITRAFIYQNAKDPSIYTGSYYFGDKWGFGTSLELPQNRNLISLYLDGDTTGFKQFNGKPIVLDGDTLTQTLYEGTLLPLDTIYLRPESKATIARMAKDKDLLKINNSFPAWMSYSSKYNFLDSPYFLDKYEGKVMDDANNSNISFKQNSDGSYYADVFDLWDLTGTGGYKAGARLEKKLATDSIENNGPFILRLHIPIVFNKDSVSDGRFLDAISVGQWQKEIDDTNKKSTGGPLYPFSFEKNPFLKTPVVRYDEGGHLFGFGDWLLNLFNTNKSLQLKLLVEDQTWQSLPDTIITTPKTNLNADISSIANTVTPGINTDMLTTRGGFNTFNKFNIGDNDIYAVDKENKLFIPLDKKLYIDNMRPRLDYIGGNKDLTRKQAIEVFGLWPSIVDVANLYLLSPDLLARRLSKEGFLDTYTDMYNQYSNKELQKTMQNNPQLFWDSEVNSYNDFGLDTVLLNYIDGNISILDLNVKEFYDDLIKNNKYTQGSNEKGDVTLNFNGSVLQLFHLQAAYFKYLESIYNARRKLGLYENIDLDTFLNAAYNLGIYNDDLQDAEWVNNNYKVPSWYTK